MSDYLGQIYEEHRALETRIPEELCLVAYIDVGQGRHSPEELCLMLSS
jgi:hypothetical protein